jgi:hypothetical protein
MSSPRSSASRRARRAAVPMGAAAALVGLLASPALASSTVGSAGTGVTVQASGACSANSRTLSLTNSGGGSKLNATTGSAGFETQVADGSGTCSDGFQVEATMSNLYQNNNGVWNCAATPIPSSNVSFSAATNPLDITGITASLNPTYLVTQAAAPTFSGTINSLLSSLGISLTAAQPSSTVAGLPLSNLTQANLGLTAGQLVNGTLANLPVNLTGGSTSSSPFTSADTPPSGSGCSGGSTATATAIPVLSGTANTALASAVNSFLGGTTPSVTSLVANGQIDQGTLLSAVLPASTVNLLNLPATNSALTLAGSSTSAVITALVASLSATVSPVVNVLGQGGTYAAAGKLAVNSNGATAGTYQGQLTLTLFDS